jgi:hypothetical protein
MKLVLAFKSVVLAQTRGFVLVIIYLLVSPNHDVSPLSPPPNVCAMKWDTGMVKQSDLLEEEKVVAQVISWLIKQDMRPKD